MSCLQETVYRNLIDEKIMGLDQYIRIYMVEITETRHGLATIVLDL